VRVIHFLRTERPLLSHSKHFLFLHSLNTLKVWTGIKICTKIILKSIWYYVKTTLFQALDYVKFVCIYGPGAWQPYIRYELTILSLRPHNSTQLICPVQQPTRACSRHASMCTISYQSNFLVC